MVQSSTITLVVAAISIASSMALPYEENDVRAVTNSEPQNPQSTLGSGTHSSGPGRPSSSPGAHSSSSNTLSFGPSPEITSTLHTGGSAGGTKTHHGSPDQTTTMHHTVTSVPHCHGNGNGSSVSGGHSGGYENHSKTPGHGSSYLGAPPPSGSAKPTIHKTSIDRRIVTASSSESGLPTHTVESGASSAQVSATHQSGGQEPYMTRPTSSQTQMTSIISKHSGEPTGCPTAGGRPGSKGGHGSGDGDNGGHGKGSGHNGGHRGSQESMSSYPKQTEGGHHGHQGTSSANAVPTQGGHGGTSSGNPDPVQTKGQRSMFRREPSLDELD